MAYFSNQTPPPRKVFFCNIFFFLFKHLLLFRFFHHRIEIRVEVFSDTPSKPDIERNENERTLPPPRLSGDSLIYCLCLCWKGVGSEEWKDGVWRLWDVFGPGSWNLEGEGRRGTGAIASMQD